MNEELHNRLVDGCELYCMMDRYEEAIKQLQLADLEYFSEGEKAKNAGFNATLGVVIILAVSIPVCFILGHLAIFIIAAIFSVLGISDAAPDLLLSCVMAVFCVLVLIPPALAITYRLTICRKLTKKRRAEGLIRYNEEILPAIEETERNLENLEKEKDSFWNANCHVLNFFPEHYRDQLALAYMERVVVTGRADTLKEAINLYEEQLHRWKIETEITRMREQQEIQNAMIDARLSDIADGQRRISSNLQNIENLVWYNTFCR